MSYILFFSPSRKSTLLPRQGYKAYLLGSSIIIPLKNFICEYRSEIYQNLKNKTAQYESIRSINAFHPLNQIHENQAPVNLFQALVSPAKNEETVPQIKKKKADPATIKKQEKATDRFVNLNLQLIRTVLMQAFYSLQVIWKRLL